MKARRKNKSRRTVQLMDDRLHPGFRMNHLTVAEFSHLSKTGVRYYKVKCDCGRTKKVRGTSIKPTGTISCGKGGCRYLKRSQPAPTADDLLFPPGTRFPTPEARRAAIASIKRERSYLAGKAQEILAAPSDAAAWGAELDDPQPARLPASAREPRPYSPPPAPAARTLMTREELAELGAELDGPTDSPVSPALAAKLAARLNRDLDLYDDL